MSQILEENSATSVDGLARLPVKGSLKKISLNIAKAVFVAGIFYWLIASDRLHLSGLSIFYKQPIFSVVLVLQWALMSLLAGAARWQLLLLGSGFRPKWLRTVQLQLIGFFFNSAMPGAIGGDLIKVVYIIRDEPGRRTAAALTILLDRMIGLMGLFTIASIGSLFFLQELLANSATRSLTLLLLIAVTGMIGFVAIVFLRFEEGRDPVERFLSLQIFGFGLIKKIYLALRVYRNQPKELFGAWGISIVIQLFNMLFVWYLTTLVTGQVPNLGSFAVIFPFAALATAVPLAPGGLGVGHVAYEKLYAFIGLSGGANVFNVYVIGTLALNMLGVIPYLLVKSKKPSVKE